MLISISVWALFYNFVSITIGRVTSHILGFPSWAVPAITFNNTASMPLLLVQSLNATGLLSSLLMSPEDSTSAAVTRAKSYFLACAVVGNTLTFGIGPSQLKGHEEDESDENGRDEEDQEQDQEGQTENSQMNGASHRDRHAQHSERTPLLGGSHDITFRQRIRKKSQKVFHTLPSPMRRLLVALGRFLSPPFFGAVIGVIIGVVPPLHRAFFNPMQHGGYLNAWLSQSIQNTGELFVTLQVVIVGVKLSASLKEQESGHDAGKLPWVTVAVISFIRYIAWPA